MENKVNEHASIPVKRTGFREFMLTPVPDTQICWGRPRICEVCLILSGASFVIILWALIKWNH
jgi:hypothetical protein